MIGYISGISIGGLFMLICIIIFLIFYSKKSKHKKLIKKIGTTAEIAINSDIKLWAKHTKNRFIPSSLFKYNENKVFEVDSILITDRALIVIEIKSIKGGIEGEASLIRWEKVLGQNRYGISNPILQNDKHIKHIVSMTSMKIPTISLIVYSNRASYIKIENVPGHVVITKHADLFDTLDDINRSLPQVINEDQVKEVYQSIKKYETTKKQDVKLHKNITQKGHK